MKNSNKIFVAIAAVLITAAGITAYIAKPAEKSEEIVFNVAEISQTETDETISEENTAKQTTKANKSTKSTKKAEKSTSKKTVSHTRKARKTKSRTTKSRKTRSKKSTARKIKSESTTETPVTLPLDLNAATVDELKQVDGIGDVIAGRIVAYRDANGGFLNRNQLLNVDGIGEAKLAQIWDSLYIDGEIFDETETVAADTEIVQAEQNDTNINNTPDMPLDTQIGNETVPVFEVDINTAKFSDFMEIPDMTEELAYAILELRNELGHFENTYELLYADGMTKSFFAEHEEYFTVNLTEGG